MRSRSLIALLVLTAALVPACHPKAHAPPVPPEPPPPSVVTAQALAPIELDVVSDTASRFVEAGKAGEILARIRIHSPEPGDVPRPRANIALVVDTSASMEGEAIEQARKASLTLLEGLKEGDMLSVVVFGSTTEVLVPATMVGEDSTPKIREAIETMKAWGTTDLAGGLQAGLDQVQAHARSGEINRIVLLSDGVPNDDAPVAGLAQQARRSGIPVTALGLGLDFHETLLGSIAQASGGKYHFVEEPSAVAAVLTDEVLSIDRLAAVGLQLTLTPGPGVTITEVPGHGLGHRGRDAVVGLPDMIEGQTHQIFVKLALGEHREGATVELLDGVLHYVDARTNAGVQRRTFAAARATADEAELEQGRNLEVTTAAARATTASATLQVVAMARSGDVKGATRMLDRTVSKARALLERTPDEELVELVEELVALKPTLPSLAPPRPPKAVATKPSRKGKATRSNVPEPQPFPESMSVPTPLSPAGARSVRRSHERAFKTLHGG